MFVVLDFLKKKKIILFGLIILLGLAIGFPHLKNYVDENKIDRLQSQIDGHGANIKNLKDYETALRQTQKELTKRFYKDGVNSDQYYNFIKEQNQKLEEMPAHNMVHCMMIASGNAVLEDMIGQINECKSLTTSLTLLELETRKNLLKKILPMQANAMNAAIEKIE